ncbi:MAG: peptidylprolyl isomerase [Candidatus Jorgensenbacteria bacterium]
MNKNYLLIAVFAALVLGVLFYVYFLKSDSSPVVTLETNFGTIKFETYPEDAPKTVENFVTLAEKGFYDGLTFHRVVSNFVIQGGDPNGNGTGGPGYQFEDELNSNAASYRDGYQKGVVAMANSGPNTNGSQFFIMLAEYPLPNLYTIFGKVIEGQEVVDKIGRVPTDDNEKPLTPVTINRAIVEK